MKRILPVLFAGLLLVGYGIAEGIWAGRWAPNEDAARAVARLRSVPINVGDWHGKDLVREEKELKAAQIEGYVSREYVNRRTGAHVSVLLVCGPAGPIAVHPPTLCFVGAGYDMAGDPKTVAVEFADGTPRAAFWTTRFVKDTDALPISAQTFWGWTATGAWQAPRNPRWTFARYHTLYKLYVTAPAGHGEQPLDQSVAIEFMRQFLPILQQKVFASTTSAATTATPVGPGQDARTGSHRGDTR